ncbi:MAG: PEP-CTERM sorting domain-containing protein [Planctomycetota bacterium]|jgi:hypothetical protein
MRLRRKIIVLAACVLIGLILGPPAAQAELVTIQIEALVDSVLDEGNYLEGKVQVGDIITGWYSYDSSTADSNPSEYIGMYEHYSSPYGISLSTGGFVFETDSANVDFSVSVGNAGGPYSMDNYRIVSRNNLSLSNGAPVDTISWQLDDPTGNALSSDALPTTAPVLDDWQSNTLSFGTVREYGIFAHVTSAVPEPGTVVLLAIGGLVLRRRS